MYDLVKEILKRLKSKQFWLVIGTSIATALGAFGGLPTPPKTFTDIIKNYPFIQWILMYILILQGGSGFDFIFAAFSTAVVFALYQIIIFFENKNTISPNLDIAVEKIKEEAKAKVEQVARQENFYQQAEAEEQFRYTGAEENFNKNEYQPAPGGFTGGPGY